MAITGAGGFLGQLARAECEDLFGTDLWGIGGKFLHVLFLFGHLDTAPKMLIIKIFLLAILILHHFYCLLAILRFKMVSYNLVILLMEEIPAPVDR